VIPVPRHYKTSSARHCYGCDKLVPVGVPHKWGGMVVFCTRKCYTSYLNIRHPVAIPSDSLIATRAIEIRAELVQANFFSSPFSHEAIAREQAIYDLTYVIEGRRRVTRQERFPPMEAKSK
jgi:hypothetical protein